MLNGSCASTNQSKVATTTLVALVAQAYRNRDVEIYSILLDWLFFLQNEKGTDLYLGVDAMGLNVYEIDNKLVPKISFPWSEIRNVSYKDKKVIMITLTIIGFLYNVL